MEKKTTAFNRFKRAQLHRTRVPLSSKRKIAYDVANSIVVHRIRSNHIDDKDDPKFLQGNHRV